jgi:CRP-like cAMP-binding protein
MIQQLYSHIKKLVPDLVVEPEEILPLFQTLSVKKDTLLLKEGEICDTIYFVNKGCLYLFYEDNYEKQVIHFGLENWWITDYKTFPDTKPAVYFIAAMEDSELTCITRKNYDMLLLRYPLLALYFNKIHERAYGAALYKQRTFATTSKKDFYRYFRTTYLELLQRIPDPIFASYMGVSLADLKIIIAEYVS